MNFLEWKKEDGHREASVMQRYHATHRDDYKKYYSLFYFNTHFLFYLLFIYFYSLFLIKFWE